MAKDSGIGSLIGWGIAGLGVWWLGSANNWFGLFGSTAAATGTPVAAAVAAPAGTPAAPAGTPAAPAAPVVPPASVSLSGPVTTTLNNALKANVSINGTVMNLSCIPGGGCYNTSGKDVTAALTALGATDSQIYALMSAAYAAQATTPGVTVTGASTTTTATPVQTKRLPISVKRSGMHGMGAMVFTTRKNYVRKASRFA